MTLPLLPRHVNHRQPKTSNCSLSSFSMFNSFKRKPPQISIFHHASSPPSLKALELLRAANSAPYPSKTPDAAPLHYELDVVESVPTPDQLRTILSYMPSKATSPHMALLSSHPASGEGETRPTTIDGIAKLAQRSPNALKWPIVVDWDDGRASVGDVEGVKAILESIRKKRDGEA